MPTQIKGESGIDKAQQGATGVTPLQFDNSNKLATTEFVQRALGNFRSSATLNTNTTLTAANIGGIVIFFGASANSTFTLPATSGLTTGASITFLNGTVYDLTLQCAGADQFGVTGATTFKLKPFDTATITRIGAQWYVMVGSAQLQIAYVAFGSSLAANGYQKLPSGLIIQWGSATISAALSGLVTFPIAFPNSALSVAVADVKAASTDGIVLGLGTTLSTTQFGVVAYNAGGASEIGLFRWIATGY